MALLKQYHDLSSEYERISSDPAAANRLKVVSERLEAIKSFVDAVDDSKARNIIYYRVIRRMPWLQIGLALGWRNADAPRIYLRRYMEHMGSSENVQMG
jgi:hypothetical protein